MSGPAGSGDDDDLLYCVLISGTTEQLSTLATADGIDVVRASATRQQDGTWTVVAYAGDPAISNLINAGITNTVLADPSMLQARWDTVQGQVE